MPRMDMLATKEKTKRSESRLNVRLSTPLKERVVRAAAILGQDLTEFAVSTLNDRDIEVIERHENFELTQTERQFFFDYMDGKIKAKPSARARRVAKDYLKGKKRGDAYELAD